jgi:hypothetical protein
VKIQKLQNIQIKNEKRRPHEAASERIANQLVGTPLSFIKKPAVGLFDINNY